MATLRSPGLKVKLLVGPTCKIPRKTTQRSERSGMFGDHRSDVPRIQSLSKLLKPPAQGSSPNRTDGQRNFTPKNPSKPCALHVLFGANHRKGGGPKSPETVPKNQMQRRPSGEFFGRVWNKPGVFFTPPE